MTRRSKQFIGLIVAILTLSAYSYAFGRGGGASGGSHTGAYNHNNAKAQHAQAEPQQAAQAAQPSTAANNQAASGRENEPVRNVVTNPFVNPAEGNRAEENRYDAAYWNRAGYWGWGPLGDWNTSSPPTIVQPAPNTP